MSARKLWGEMEEEPIDEESLQNVNLDPIIELGLQNIPELFFSAQSPPIELPKPNLITHTVHLHAYKRQLTALLTQAKRRRNFRLDFKKIPAEPLLPTLIMQHDITSPVAFLERRFTNFALGQGPTIQPFNPESHNQAMRQCAAIAIGHVGMECTTNSVIIATADALDAFMTKFCNTMRNVVDREATVLNKDTFTDIMTKVLFDANIGNLSHFYEKRVVKYHDEVKDEATALRAKCEKIAAKYATPAPEMKVDDVPQLHFPAAIDGAFSPSLQPGFQMLQNLEQQELQDIQIGNVVSSNVRSETMEFMMPGPAPKAAASLAKKKRK